jgi:hypothetical protein
MTFYNLPETDVKIEYFKDQKFLKVTGLPRTPPGDVSVIEAINHETETNEVYITWGIVTEQHDPGR